MILNDFEGQRLLKIAVKNKYDLSCKWKACYEEAQLQKLKQKLAENIILQKYIVQK